LFEEQRLHLFDDLVLVIRLAPVEDDLPQLALHLLQIGDPFFGDLVLVFEQFHLLLMTLAVDEAFHLLL
jgi:hypothetical protein